MKPVWDKLIAKYSGSGVIADIDCTKEPTLCSRAGVDEYPTIMYGQTNDLKPYDGKTDFDSLFKFANENLGPTCGPGDRLEHCDGKQKAVIEAAMAKDVASLEVEIKKGDDAIAKAFTDFEAAMKSLLAQAKGYDEAKENAIMEVDDSVELLRVVHAHRTIWSQDNVTPFCGPNNLKLCDDVQKAEIGAAMIRDLASLAVDIKNADDAIAKAVIDFEAAMSTLPSADGLIKARKETIDEIAYALSLLKVVRAIKKEHGSDKEL